MKQTAYELAERLLQTERERHSLNTQERRLLLSAVDMITRGLGKWIFCRSVLRQDQHPTMVWQPPDSKVPDQEQEFENRVTSEILHWTSD